MNSPASAIRLSSLLDLPGSSRHYSASWQRGKSRESGAAASALRFGSRHPPLAPPRRDGEVEQAVEIALGRWRADPGGLEARPRAAVVESNPHGEVWEQGLGAAQRAPAPPAAHRDEERVDDEPVEAGGEQAGGGGAER